MPRPLRPIAAGLIYHVISRGNNRQPVFHGDDHPLAVLRYIEASPLRAAVAGHAGEYRWSSFGCHGAGRADPLLAATVPYEALAAGAAARQRRWSAYVHQTPDEAELAAIRRSNETGLPYGARSWVDRPCRRLKLDLTIRPRGRPRKTIAHGK